MNKNAQRGNAVVVILIAIALFSALAFTFMRGAKTGQGNLTAGQAKTAATEIVQYGSAVEKTVNKLMSKQCSENQLTVQNASLAGYTNANAPVDASCHIYGVGGGLTYSAPQSPWLDSTRSASAEYGHWGFIGSTLVLDVGAETGVCSGRENDCVELTMILPYVKREVCIAINNLLGIANTGGEPPAETGYWMSKFTGTFAMTWGMFGDDVASGPLRGHPAGCFYALSFPANNGYHFYSVVWAR